MHELTEAIRKDMVPALGVTEPGAIAFAVATARKYVTGELVKIRISLNSGMYKNAFTCGIPGSVHVGNLHAAALGYVAGAPEEGLESLKYVTEEDDRKANEIVKSGKVEVLLSGFSSYIDIRAEVTTDKGSSEVTIREKHTNITEIKKDGRTVFRKEYGNEKEGGPSDDESIVHRYSLKEIFEYVKTVPLSEISFVREAYRVNLELFNEGLKSVKTSFAGQLLRMNGGKIISEDEKKTASLLCNTAIEARVIGLDKPAMSITGSGAHGIIATLPLYAVYKIRKLEEDQLYRATMLSYLICTYIKEWSGRLSAFCGCGIAAGTGMACGLSMLRGGSVDTLVHVINNMASSITGMICDGGNQGCTMKGIAACNTAFDACEFAMNGISIGSVHGINGNTPEETMRNMGMIASPGMVETEKTIVRIQQMKLSSKYE
ncbi:MAG: serine dehydratase subunit alpha family protein [Clostridia bacterium]|nr:serine dehydratase subunit alpha family protein [Clostridia bacterium]